MASQNRSLTWKLAIDSWKIVKISNGREDMTAAAAVAAAAAAAAACVAQPGTKPKERAN